MRVAVLSGKGGTGKTLVSVNLAAASEDAIYIDCDVEEPNGHLFFKPEGIVTEQVTVAMPAVVQERCNGCRECIEFCSFGAMAYIVDKLIIFQEICHACGGCALVCPEKAIFEKGRSVGVVQTGSSEGVKVLSGFMEPGEASGVPIIKALLDPSKMDRRDVFIDCPPGSACIVMESIKDADYCLLVAEPTVFGAHNLQMVHELVTLFGKPHGAVLNKYLGGEDPSGRYCRENGIPILSTINFDNDLGQLNANGSIAVRVRGKYLDLFTRLLEQVRKEAGA